MLPKAGCLQFCSQDSKNHIAVVFDTELQFFFYYSAHWICNKAGSNIEMKFESDLRVYTPLYTRTIIYSLSDPCMFSMLLVFKAHVRLPPLINSLCLYQNLYGIPTAWLRGTPEVIPEVISPPASLSGLPTLCLFLLVLYVLLAYISSLFRMSTSFVGHSVVPLI